MTRLNRLMKRVALFASALALALAGCGESTEEEWGGYTEAEAKDLLKDDQFLAELEQTSPTDPRGPLRLLYPSDEEIDDYDLRKATVQGEEAWEYKREFDEGPWCIYVSEDPAAPGKFLAQIGPCYVG